MCLIGFFIAIFIHSILRGNGNVFEGMKNIYEKDPACKNILHAILLYPGFHHTYRLFFCTLCHHTHYR